MIEPLENFDEKMDDTRDFRSSVSSSADKRDR